MLTFELDPAGEPDCAKHYRLLQRFHRRRAPLQPRPVGRRGAQPGQRHPTDMTRAVLAAGLLVTVIVTGFAYGVVHTLTAEHWPDW